MGLSLHRSLEDQPVLEHGGLAVVPDDGGLLGLELRAGHEHPGVSVAHPIATRLHRLNKMALILFSICTY